MDAIRTAVQELEQAGYVSRRQGRDSRGKMTAVEYLIYEQPRTAQETPRWQKPRAEDPVPDNPTPDDPIPGYPISGNPMQINKEEIKTELTNTEAIKKEETGAPDPIDAPAVLTEVSGGNRREEETDAKLSEEAVSGQNDLRIRQSLRTGYGDNPVGEAVCRPHRGVPVGERGDGLGD